MTATPYSYRQYAGNGSTTSFAVPFPYLLKSHVHVYLGFNVLDGTYVSELAETTGFNWTSGTQIQTVAAPAAGQTLTVIRQTPNSQQVVEWQDGSTLIAADLNTSDLQNLYVVQEQQDRNDTGITQSTAAKTAATTATSTANTALGTANTALGTANTAASNASAAVSTANTANTNASAAVTTAGTANTNASAAVTTANAANATAATASTNASNAVTTANTAAADATTAVSAANTAATSAAAAVTAANSAVTAANAAVSTANTASANATTAVSTANSANSSATSAVSTANTANTNSNTAISTANAATSTANTASAKADAAIAAAASSVNYTPITNVAGIPSSPANNTYIEIADSTGLESFTPLTGMPVGFVGDSGLSVRLRYTTTPATWNWLNYYANNSDTRYLKLAGGTLTGSLTLAGAPTASLHPATKAYTDAADATLTTAAAAAQSTADAALPKTGGTMTGAIVFDSTQAKASTTGYGLTQLTDSVSSTSTTTAATPASVKTANDVATAAQSTANAALPKAGGTMTGAITFAAGQSFPGVVTSVNGTAPISVTGIITPTVSVNAGTTAAAGVLQLTDSTSSTSVTTAATPNSVKSAYDLANTANTTANAALPKAGGAMTGNITFAGTQPTATTSAAGIVQLTDSTSSTSTTTAATPQSVKSVQDFAQVVSITANAAMPKAGGTFTGDVTFGTNTAVALPSGTTAQRPTGTTGMIRFNSTLGGFEGYSGSAWGTIGGGGATGGSSDRVFVETGQTITSSYTLSTGYNAVSAGPVAINSGVNVVIPSGASWVIV